MPQISIITPVYCDVDEKLQWLDEMIESVVNQSVADWELILINDKSPMSLDYVRSKYNNDTRIRWLHNAENSKPSKTRNTAVALAESECVLPLDSDDMLPENNVLEQMYQTWQQDKTKIIYGNLQQLTRDHNGFKRGKVFSLGEYTFELAMNLEGVMPVTSMHSIQCHHAAGGWKSELDEGLEDLEYWIAAGERGYCGKKIPVTTLLYRRQENSRAYKLKHVNKNFREMQEKIKSLHAPIYRGEFPMSCCGKGKKSNPVNSDPVAMTAQASSQNARVITTLASRGFNFDESELEWVAYRGPKKGSSGRFLVPTFNKPIPGEYPNLGNGHVFQIHKRHHEFFRVRQNLGYRINQPDPRQNKDEVTQSKPPVPEPQIIELPKPELSTVVSLDKIGSETREPEIIVEPNAPQSFSASMTGQKFDYEISENSNVDNLGLSDSMTKTLSRDNWTIEKLAETTPQRLSSYRGIGVKRANKIIDRAKKLIDSQ